jgi:hypothetical protein
MQSFLQKIKKKKFEDFEETEKSNKTPREKEKDQTRNYIFLFGLATYVIIRIVVSIIFGI